MLADQPLPFFDTNVFVYLRSGDIAKADRAETVLVSGGIISVQVLNEFTQVARRKLNLSWPQIAETTKIMRTVCAVQPLTERMYLEACRLAQQYQLGVYDAMIVAAALAAGCDKLLSEDMHAGLVVDGALTISNPFV